MKKYIKIAERYRDEVLSGKIPASKLTRAACQRQADDLNRIKSDPDFPYVFNPLMVDNDKKEYQPAFRICDFAEKLHHVKGEWKGQTLVLEAWQCFFLTTLFGWVHKKTGYRRFRECYAEIPRKNGKSIIGAIIGLYMFCYDDEGGAEVYSGATSEKQAWEVFRPAKLMAKKNTAMQEELAVEVHAKDLMVTTDYSRFEPLIGNPGDGSSPHCAIIDEYHEHKTAEQYDTMSTGMGARTQPLLCVITTAGSNMAGPCYEKRTQAVNVVNGVFVNDGMFVLLFTIDQEDDWQDFRNWIKANPNINVSVYKDYLKRQLAEAQQNTSKQNIIRCKHLNQWMSINVAWMDMDKWRACVDPNLREEDCRDMPCIMGGDFASKLDFCALSRIYIGQDGKKYLFSDFYLPSGTALDPKKTHYLKWMNDGSMIVTDGPTVDFSRIEEDIYQFLAKKTVSEFAYDPHQATHMINLLYNRLLVGKGAKEVEKTLIEVGQTVLNLSEPMKELQKAVYDGFLVHTGHPIMDWMMANVVCHYDIKDNVYPRKPDNNESAKIDGPVSAIIAWNRALVFKPKKRGNDGTLI